jgi:transcription elongation GreA/GreB family factor
MIWFRRRGERFWHFYDLHRAVPAETSVFLTCQGVASDNQVFLDHCQTRSDDPLPPDGLACELCLSRASDALRRETDADRDRALAHARGQGLAFVQAQVQGRLNLSADATGDDAVEPLTSEEVQAHVIRFVAPVEAEHARRRREIETYLQGLQRVHDRHYELVSDRRAVLRAVRDGVVRPGVQVTLRFPDEPDWGDVVYFVHAVDAAGRAVNPDIPPPSAGAETLLTNLPLGEAVLGRRVGDEFDYLVSGGRVRCAVVSVEAPSHVRHPAAAGVARAPSAGVLFAGEIDDATPGS